MIVSFFDDGTSAVGIDYTYTPAQQYIPPEINEDGEIITPEIQEKEETGRSDCIGVYEVDFNINTQTVRLENGEVVIEELPTPPESYEDKKARIIQSLIHTDDPTIVDTEGITGFDIDSMILARFFRGDRGKEIGFTQRFIYLQSLSEKTPEETQELEIIKAGYLAKEAFKTYISSL